MSTIKIQLQQEKDKLWRKCRIHIKSIKVMQLKTGENQTAKLSSHMVIVCNTCSANSRVLTEEGANLEPELKKKRENKR